MSLLGLGGILVAKSLKRSCKLIIIVYVLSLYKFISYHYYYYYNYNHNHRLPPPRLLPPYLPLFRRSRPPPNAPTLSAYYSFKLRVN